MPPDFFSGLGVLAVCRSPGAGEAKRGLGLALDCRLLVGGVSVSAGPELLLFLTKEGRGGCGGGLR